MHGLEFHVNKDDIRISQIVDTKVSTDLADGEILLAVDKFALTANNITYAATGDIIGYWKFFPAAKPWGIVPVWGFADIITSTIEGVLVGERIYGFFPFASHLIMRPGRIKTHSFVDVSEHRAALPPIYNDYIRLGSAQSANPSAEDIQALFQPLFATSFLIHDFFNERDCFGANNIILGSASSKTAMGVARLFAREDKPGRRVIGLTSAGNVKFVRALGDYDLVFAYEDVQKLAKDEPSAYIDMAGNAAVKRQLHEHLQDNMVYSCAVGLSHWDKFEDTGPIPGAKPVFFFAPDQALKRRKEWGGAVLQGKIETALNAWASDGMGWLNIVHGSGPDDAQRIFCAIRDGNIFPDTGYVVSLTT